MFQRKEKLSRKCFGLAFAAILLERGAVFVFCTAKGEVEGVKYDRLSVVFVNAFKEQQTQIEQQQNRIKKQQSEIESLKRLVCLNQRQANVCRQRLK